MRAVRTKSSKPLAIGTFRTWEEFCNRHVRQPPSIVENWIRQELIHNALLHLLEPHKDCTEADCDASNLYILARASLPEYFQPAIPVVQRALDLSTGRRRTNMLLYSATTLPEVETVHCCLLELARIAYSMPMPKALPPDCDTSHAKVKYISDMVKAHWCYAADVLLQAPAGGGSAAESASPPSQSVPPPLV